MYIAIGILILVFHRSIDAYLGAPIGVAGLGSALAFIGALYAWHYRKRRPQPGKAELREIAEDQPRLEMRLCILYWALAALSLAAWATYAWPLGALTLGQTISIEVFALLVIALPFSIRSMNIVALSRNNPALHDERARENHVKGIESGFAVGLQTALLLSLAELLGLLALAGAEVGLLTAAAMMLTAMTRTAWRNWKDAQ
ncbi:MAG: hypothetical protein CVT72_12090 [Alphaproteobacteria bacterium HGW-Alphaproteobacteria-11]|nr:MAG: hypothetical protein CVT72_12090 [Alphaproteobacteria bacterium HGW-Alphaproteobacteria-11]